MDKRDKIISDAISTLREILEYQSNNARIDVSEAAKKRHQAQKSFLDSFEKHFPDFSKIIKGSDLSTPC